MEKQKYIPNIDAVLKKKIYKIKAQLIYQPNNFKLNNDIAGLYFDAADYDRCIKHYEKCLIINRNAITLSNLGLANQLSLKFQIAVDLFQDSINEDPEYYPAYINLGNVLGSLGLHEDLLRCSLNALSRWPNNAELHCNIGVALMGLGRHKEARFSMETALLLDPESIDALVNIASIEAFEKNHLKAIEIYESLLERPKLLNHARFVQIKHALGFEYLNLGRLKEGWNNYEYGFSPLIPHQIKRNPSRNFIVPRWDGSPLNNQILLIWGEQGIGDEILFSSIFNEVSVNVANIIIECEPRLVSIFERSFPELKIRESAYDPLSHNDQKYFDYDLQIPMGSLAALYRGSLDNFTNARSIYLKSNYDKNMFFSERLVSSNKRLKIGITWRSGLLNALRNLHYANILDWGEIFTLNNAEFVNLQWGDCEEEIVAAENNFGIKIHRWPDVDLKNDLDDVLSIIHNVDLVIAPCTAAAWLSASIGKPTLVFQQRDWINFGQDYFPFNSNVKSFFANNSEAVASTFPRIRRHIIDNFY
jgi:tetratricopeptide (TPR) repeat protein